MTLDEELARAVASGDEIAANRFDQMFRQKVEAFARKRDVPSSDCADVAQEVLADALRQLRQGKFRGEASLATWLHPIVNGWMANYFRKRGRLQAVSLEDIAADDRSMVATSNIDAVVVVNQALSRLSVADRVLLLLHEREKLTLEEIGQIVGLRKSAVGERLARARAQFRAAIRDGGINPDSQRLKD